MPDFEAPDRDAIEPEEPADTAGAAEDVADAALEAPEADRVEQQTPLRTPTAGGSGDRPIEADDADAADQAQVVDYDEDEYR